MCVLSRVRVSGKKNKNKEEKKKTLYLVSVLSSRQNRVRLFSLVIYYITTPHVVHRPAVTAYPTLLEMQMGAIPLGTSWVRICIQARVPGDSGLRNTGFVWMGGFLWHWLTLLNTIAAQICKSQLPSYSSSSFLSILLNLIQPFCSAPHLV